MLVLVCLRVVLLFGSTFADSTSRNLYEILGVEESATTKVIKSAYRRKALDTHPDKNKSVSAEEAAAAFREVVLAFEILSDPERREYYDNTGLTGEEEDEHGDYHGQQEQYHWHFHWHDYAQQGSQLRDTWEAQLAQSRMMHVVSLDQFRNIMLDESGKLERSFVVCFVKPGPMEAVALDHMVFPYPFAGLSDQEIWWENILQTMYVRVTPHETPLAAFFGISKDDSTWKQPIFVFGESGSTLDEVTQFSRIQTSDRQAMENFVWDQLQVEVEFINEHSHTVELFWMNGEFLSRLYANKVIFS